MFRRICLLSVAIACTGAPLRAERVEGYAATVQPFATRAALDAMTDGGNAIDAAVAAALTLGVVDGHNSGVGGGCFLLIHLKDGRNICIDGREIAPLAATRDMYVRDGKLDESLSKTGPLAPGVPGAIAAYSYAIKEYGRLPWKKAFAAGIRCADDGFPIDLVYARKLKATAPELALFPASRAIFLKPDGSPYLEGEILRQKDLAKSYRELAEQGAEWFYTRPFPEVTQAYMKEAGGILTAEDFATYKIKLREPLITSYHGWQIVGFPPPSSGGVHVAQMLNILENFDPAEVKPGTPEFVNRLTEVMKLAFADRAYWLGDPGFVKVPTGLFDKTYAKELAAKVASGKVTPVPDHGTPPDWQNNYFEKHTTHFVTADAEGNWVSCTATINTAFGSKVVIPGTGILMNNEMDDFSIAPGVPNHFKLIGGEANAIAPGKRPLSSMSPTIVEKDGKVVLAVGAAGGPTIITQTLLALLYTLDYDMTPADALALPRFHHQWSPDQLRMEKNTPPALVSQLKALGYEVELIEPFGGTQMIRKTADGKLTGASDPRVPGLAAPTK
ncbi:MAG: gamma-glutamyltransferase [Verrucomicrobia bacterium 61-8]|nr:gamma-glutamyltransferase [Verrucomicrobiota bacterium]OJU99383.1 MAG: gamma-glutamyltransferase [Verrucomicrobia bacterium 61-8]